MNDSLKKKSTNKNNVRNYIITKTWMYGHQDVRPWSTIEYLASQDFWLKDDIDKETKNSGFNFQDPKLIGQIVACWDDPNKNGKRICDTFF